MKSIDIQVSSVSDRIAVFSSEKGMAQVAKGRKITPVMRRARKALGDVEPLLVVVPQKNVSHIF